MNNFEFALIGIIFLLVVAYFVSKSQSGKKAQAPAREIPKARVSEPPKPEPLEAQVPMSPAAPAPTAVVATASATLALGAHVPQDSVLRRHFETHLAHMLESVAAPRPTDSVLKRHHEHLLSSQLQACLHDEACLDKLICDYEVCRAHQASAAIQAPAAGPSGPAPAQVAEHAPTPVRIPEDSVLRRHFLSQITYMLESLAAPRPTDSVLRRHYEHWLLNQLTARLGDESRMKKLMLDYETCRTSKT